MPNPELPQDFEKRASQAQANYRRNFSKEKSEEDVRFVVSRKELADYISAAVEQTRGNKSELREKKFFFEKILYEVMRSKACNDMAIQLQKESEMLIEDYFVNVALNMFDRSNDFFSQ